MAGKIFIGNGKKTQYSINCEIDLIKIIEIIAEKKGKTEAIKKLIKLAEGKAGFYANSDKGHLKIKVQVKERRESDQYGQTHYITLNDWIAEQKKEVKQTEEESDDLPF